MSSVVIYKTPFKSKIVTLLVNSQRKWVWTVNQSPNSRKSSDFSDSTFLPNSTIFQTTTFVLCPSDSRMEHPDSNWVFQVTKWTPWSCRRSISSRKLTRKWTTKLCVFVNGLGGTSLRSAKSWLTSLSWYGLLSLWKLGSPLWMNSRSRKKS